MNERGFAALVVTTNLGDISKNYSHITPWGDLCLLWSSAMWSNSIQPEEEGTLTSLQVAMSFVQDSVKTVDIIHFLQNGGLSTIMSKKIIIIKKKIWTSRGSPLVNKYLITHILWCCINFRLKESQGLKWISTRRFFLPPVDDFKVVLLDRVSLTQNSKVSNSISGYSSLSFALRWYEVSLNNRGNPGFESGSSGLSLSLSLSSLCPGQVT